MACQTIILCCRNLTLTHYSIRMKLFNKNMKYFPQITRTISTTFLHLNKNTVTTTTEQPSTIVDLLEFKRINFIGTKYVYLTLQKLFNISMVEAKAMTKRYPRFRKCSSETINSNYQFFRSEGISDDLIRKSPLILTLSDAPVRLTLIKELSLDLNKTAPLLTANIKYLRNMVNEANKERSSVPYGSRIVLISKILNVPEWKISELLVKHTYVVRIPSERLETVLKTLIEYGVETENILKDFWVLRYSPEIAEVRLKAAIDANVQKVKAWMVRCTDSVFQRCISRQIENRKILGSYSSVAEYLSERLECTLENAKYLTEKHPAIKKMNTLKMKETIDYLFEQGYTPGHICRVPRILVHSLDTTKKRISQLKQYGFFPPSLAILCKSKRDYDKYLKKYFKKGTQEEEKKLKNT